MAFNAENLFDTADDPDNPRDDTYLPLSVKRRNGTQHEKRCEQYNKAAFYQDQCKSLNWDEQTYGMKLQRYAEVLKAMPQMPDVLVIPETENKRVLEDLTHPALTNGDADQFPFLSKRANASVLPSTQLML